ncbi:hypothetical protein PND93_02895 [Faecalicoccus pleomorphus]|uniref:hypothetical protein n=1 Tax=Faecalicoccus pleomorphus TaxID=1323 RepID=UPI00232AB4AE|nr:hypothetical protein [Faecalicoccus pleomorphus]MDB7990532.1 hypothetical protein [Faecalicoccus pleomorphus]
MLILKNNYTIDSDGNSYTLRRKTNKFDKNGKEIILTCGYYADLETSIKGYITRLLLDEVNNKDLDVKELARYLKELRNEIKEIREEIVNGK